MAEEEVRLLHAHGQESPHDDVWIMGNRAGLLALKQATEKALEKSYGGEDAFVAGGSLSDKEGFCLHVYLLDEPPDGPHWPQAAVPYWGRLWMEKRRKDVVWPWDIIPTQKIPPLSSWEEPEDGG